MSYYNTPFPSDDVLRDILSDVTGFSDLCILSRVQNKFSSTYPVEVVTSRDAAGRETALFVKYEPLARAQLDFSFLQTERLVYEQILPLVGLDHCEYVGTYADAFYRCLVVGFIDGVTKVSKVADYQSALKRAASWIATFHNRAEKQMKCLPPAFISKFDRAYPKIIDRSVRRLSHYRPEFSWINELCETGRWALRMLDKSHKTVVHGEFYPNNVLVDGESIIPVDWESAAVGPEAIDLAALLLGWPDEVAAECIDEYLSIRQGGRDPAFFARDYHRSRLLLQFAWLGGPKFSIQDNKPPWPAKRIAAIEPYYKAVNC